MTKKKFNQHIIAIVVTVISGIILMVIEPIRDVIFFFIKRIWNLLVNIISIVWTFLRSTHAINGGLIVLLSMMSAAFIIFLIIFLLETLKGKAYKDYNEDTFYNLKWRWRWRHSGIENLWCYCPNCDFALTYDDTSTKRYNYDQNPRTEFICDHCGQTITSVSGHDKDFILGIIEREIQRKIRNNLHIKEKTTA